MQNIENSFLQIYQQSRIFEEMPSDQNEVAYIEESSQFKEDLLMNTKTLFQGDKQEYIIIWGDPNVGSDNENAKQGLISRYPFLKGRIYQFENSQDFRKKSLELAASNILFLMSGTFANYFLDGKSNLEWVNNNIREQKIHSKSIILFTSMATVKKNNWTIQNLQQKFKYVTQLTVDYELLFTSFDKMIFNRIHRSIVQNSHLDYYFRSQTEDILNIFQKPNSHTFKDLQSSLKNLSLQFQQLCEYVKEKEIQAPLTLYLSKIDLQDTITCIDQCFTKNKASENDYSIVENFIKLYTQESPVYRILNFSLNTMNLEVYKYLKDVFKVLSKCMYQYNDYQEISEITLFRGAAIQKYQYDTLYQEFVANQNKGRPTFISFPQFLSTSNVEKVARDIIKSRIAEVKVENTGRLQILNQYSVINKEYLQSDEFRKAYKVLIKINAKFDPKNQFKPKSIKEISTFKHENEFLFQPFQSFRIDSMDQGGNEGDDLKMNLTYIL
ncbi:hypothetical protein ABPG72_022195 [Tetrahymena utriculariae]